MYRISVTTLEKFRRYMAGVSSYDTEEALIESLKGIFLGNDKTKTGGAFHKIIEKDYTMIRDRNGSEFYRADNILFTPAQAKPALDYKAAHPLMVHEIPVTKVYQLSNGESIMVSGRVDGLEGVHVHDAKTKFRTIDVQEYIESYQWRFYLDMLSLSIFFYDVFEVRGFDALKFAPPHFLPDVQFMDPVTIPCQRYEGMHHDCRSLLNDFMDYIANRNFFHLLKQANETTSVF